MRLLGRDAECRLLDRLLRDAVAGRSGVVVLRGEAGIGKSALLGYVSERAERTYLARAVGVESEMELAFGGVHQLCAPMLDHLERLPPPQRTALATAFGLTEGPPPDRFLVGLATLTLLAEVAERQPLVCVVDDAQWLDQVSAQVLAFVARRLLAERVAIVCAARPGTGDAVLAGLPEVHLGRLGDSDALTLLLENLHGPLDAAVSARIVAESHGNPLALLELPRTWSVAELAGGFGFPESLPATGRIEASYVRRLRRLPSDTQLLVLAAAAEPVGDAALLQRAADRLGIDMAAADAAEDEGLLSIRGRAEFAHPLVRASTYRAAPARDRHRVHRALADATDADDNPDRRAWHLASATAGPDDEVAVELERSARRAQGRGGINAAAAFLQRAVELTGDSAQQAERAVTAAEVSFQAGRFEATPRLLASAEAAGPNSFQRGRIDLVRGQLAFASGVARDAARLLFQAATQLEALDEELARQTYVAAWGAASVAGQEGADILSEISRAVRTLAPRPDAPAPIDLLLEGLALLTSEGRAAATPVLQRAAKALVDLPLHDIQRWGWMAPAASNAVWDNDGAYAIARHQVQLVRDSGALADLPLYLSALGLASAWMGDLAGAASNLAEAESVAAATGGRVGPWVSLRLRALQGREAETTTAIADALEQAALGAQGIEPYAHWAAAVLNNGLCRYEEAAASARQCTSSETSERWVYAWALPELVEAASRIGDAELAGEALERLVETTTPCGTDVALGIEARSRGLMSVATAAEPHHREAIERLGRTRLRPELARARLLYGEWLRREGRRLDAREQLRAAYEMFVTVGMEAFAERARHELMATGEKVRKRTPESRDEFTPQEEQIARLARDGFSNQEIAAQLFISARTVEWHLGKVFTKLGVSSRRQLRTALPNESVLIGST